MSARALGLGLWLAACGAGAEPAGAEGDLPSEPGWPPGTVLAVDGAPISVDEVDQASVWVERIEPAAAERQLRRLALANVVLPRAVAALEAPAERERAREAAEARLAELRAGAFVGPEGPDGALGTLGEGNWQVLGLALWGQAIDWPPGEWHLLEEPGRFVVARCLAREDRIHPTMLSLTVDSFPFAYLPEGFDLDAAAGDHRLTIVDPLWREIVPELTQYRMGVHTP